MQIKRRVVVWRSQSSLRAGEKSQIKFKYFLILQLIKYSAELQNIQTHDEKQGAERESQGAGRRDDFDPAHVEADWFSR